MKSINKLIRQDLKIRVIGFDDAPFMSRRNSPVNVAGVVCSGTRFEGMLWGEVHKDGSDATDIITDLLLKSKFNDQVHMVLIDGLAFGGFNLIDLPELACRLDRPCVTVMRKPPDITAIKKALMHFTDYESRIRLLEKAGEIHNLDNFYFQVIGEEPSIIGSALKSVSDQGNVPEALRLAHLIGSAVITGQSSRRA